MTLELTAHEAEALVAWRFAQITPPQRPVRQAGAHPMAVLIGGTPGTGKSTIQWLLQASLGADSVAVYDYDDDAKAHPRYDAIMREHGLMGQELVVQHLPPKLFSRCLDHLRRSDPPYDLIASAPLETADVTRRWIDGFHAVDYRVPLVYVVTNEANSALGRANRYQLARDDTGIGRWVVDPGLGPRADRAIPDNALAIEAASYADDLYIVDRDGYVLYENHRGDDGRMPPPHLARQEMLAERNRPPTQEEHDLFVATAVPLLDRTDLEQPVADLVRWTWDKHAQRGAPQPITRAPLYRLDQRLIALHRITAAGVAPPQMTSSAMTTARGTSGRSPTGSQRQRAETDR
ncbi:zeta toxin [Kribbella antiqua]|uniref:UDP-N-acetylglucosamine kinase n=1 Tax=Kribbella antiqua TaxID=2512217 RepID=A0A4R2IKU9_9ACTN|nr:zeta toxin family protein [Kribbella antiqua]TCO44508.1 zeta toxin [Kribbella antiqua]